MARRRRDLIDLLGLEWAMTRRELLGLADAKTARSIVGPMRCSLGRVREYRDGAGSYTAGDQPMPEVYTGDALAFNRAFKTLRPEHREIIDAQYCLRLSAIERAELLHMSVAKYYVRLTAAKSAIEAALAGAQTKTAG